MLSRVKPPSSLTLPFFFSHSLTSSSRKHTYLYFTLRHYLLYPHTYTHTHCTLSFKVTSSLINKPTQFNIEKHTHTLTLYLYLKVAFSLINTPTQFNIEIHTHSLSLSHTYTIYISYTLFSTWPKTLTKSLFTPNTILSSFTSLSGSFYPIQPHPNTLELAHALRNWLRLS